ARRPLTASAARSDSSAVTKTLACAMSRETSTSDTLNDGSPCSATASRTSVPSSLRSCAAMRSVRWKDLVIGTGSGLENGERRTGTGRNGAGTGMPGRWPCVHRPCCGTSIATDALQRPLDLDALEALDLVARLDVDRKSTRLNSSHVKISYAVFCLKKKKTKEKDNNN